jgi:hypothetical protein
MNNLFQRIIYYQKQLQYTDKWENMITYIYNIKTNVRAEPEYGRNKINILLVSMAPQ